ncbi:tRNA-guanine(15) transglycosylase-like protein [Dissophora ornata]|nr:Queuine tRNA-ribosyltransferase subunit qtrtd1 [Dissophora ornata]KAI8601906.1 tRNA-guanine(15) transglycosylase-like protein [Dissophora ornata]
MSPLRFCIHASAPEPARARCGTLSISKADQHGSTDQNGSSSKRVIETPGCFMYSIKGSVPHLTPDNMRLQDFGGIHVSLEQILQTDQPGSFTKWPSTPASPKFTLADYLHLQDLILLCDLRDYSSPSPSSSSTPDSSTSRIGPNTDRHVLLSTPKGVRQLTLDDYLKVVRQFQPDIVSALADNITDAKEPAQKRVHKSIDRTLRWLDQILVERQGGDGRIEDRRVEEEKRVKKEKKERRKAMAKEQQRLEDNKQEPESRVEVSPIATEAWTDVAVFANVQGSQFEEERIWSAEETAKREGVDGFIVNTAELTGWCGKDEIWKLVQTSIERLPAQKPRLVSGIQAPEDILKAVALGVDLFDTSYPYQLTEDGKASLYYFGESGAATAPTTGSSNNSRWINLWDDEHGDKFVPILEGCECYACKGSKHSRAYINHLLKTHEMLATVLLMSHNMYQYGKFFAAVREAVKAGTLDQSSKTFHEKFGVEPIRTGEKHPAQIVVEAALSKRNQRLDGAEPAVVEAIGLGEKGMKKRPEGDEKAEKEIKKVKKAQGSA